MSDLFSHMRPRERPTAGPIWIMEYSERWKRAVIVGIVHEPANMIGEAANAEMERRARLLVDALNGGDA